MGGMQQPLEQICLLMNRKPTWRPDCQICGAGSLKKDLR